MSRNLLWVFLVTAPLVGATSFQATCSFDLSSGNGSCGGGFSDSSFTFSGPFLPGFPGSNQFAPFEPVPFVDFEVGTAGGGFTYHGAFCDYGVVLSGVSCDGEIMLGSTAVTPNDTGLSLGDVVSVVGAGTSKGFFCEPCTGPPPQVLSIEVRATYQFTLTAPGTLTPFASTGAQVSSVPEPETWPLMTIGLAAVATRFRRRSGYSRVRSYFSAV